MYLQTVHVVQEVLNAKEVFLLLLSEDCRYARLIARSGHVMVASLTSRKVNDHAFLRHILEKESLFVNKKLDPSAPMMAAPIRCDGKIAAIVCAKGIDFDHMSLYMENVLTIVADMAGTALSRAFIFTEARAGGGN